VYPKALASEHNMLEDYARSIKLFPKKKNTSGDGEEAYRRRVNIIEKDKDTGVMYTQDNLITGTNNMMHASIKHRGCHKYGHYLSYCTETEEKQNLNVNQEDLVEDEDDSEDEGANHMQLKELNSGDSSSSDGSYMVDYRNFQFLQKGKEGKTGESSKHWIYSRDKKNLLLDTGSNFSCCNSPRILVGVRKCKKPINVVSNGGVMVTDKGDDLPDPPLSITILCH